MPGEYEILRSLLSDRPIAFHPMLSRVFGGINEALLFQQIAYWSDKGADPEWIYKTQKDIEEETTLTRTQQENARRKLRGLGVIEEDKRGVPAKLYYRVIWNEVYRLLEEQTSQSAGNLQPRMLSAVKDAENPQPRMREIGTQERGEDAIQSGVRTRSITENTQRKHQIESVEVSKGQTIEYDQDRLALLPFVEDFSREFGDVAPLPSSLTRLVNIYKRSGLGMEDFIDRLYTARALTKEHSGTITKTQENAGPWAKKNRFPYFVAIVEDLIEAS